MQFCIIILWHIAKLQQANSYYLETVSFEAQDFTYFKKHVFIPIDIGHFLTYVCTVYKNNGIVHCVNPVTKNIFTYNLFNIYSVFMFIMQGKIYNKIIIVYYFHALKLNI